MINLYNQDCMEAMKDMPDKAYDLAIVDPPYGIGFDGEVPSMVTHGIDSRWKNRHGNGYKRKGWDDDKPLDSFFYELYRCSKNQIIWGGNYFNLPITNSWIFWDKGVASDFTLSDGELAWTSFSKPLKKVYCLWAGFRKSEQVVRIHPTQKPVKLYEWLLRNYAKQGDKILDTHLGSGSIAIACYNLGFDLTGYELDKDYYEAAMERLDNHKRQGLLFEPQMVAMI